MAPAVLKSFRDRPRMIRAARYHCARLLLLSVFSIVVIWLLRGALQRHQLIADKTLRPIVQDHLEDQQAQQQYIKNYAPVGWIEPAYFNGRFSKSGDLDELLEDYSKWHAAQLQRAREAISDDQKCQQDKRVKFMVFKPWATSGLANVMIGLASSFLVSLLTERVFLVEWPGHWSCRASVNDLFQHPNDQFNWIYDKHLHESYVKSCGLGRSLFANTLGDKHVDVGSNKPGSLQQYGMTLEITHREESLFTNGLFKCADFRKVMDELGGDWVESTSNQFFAPVLRDNALYQPLLRRLYDSLASRKKGYSSKDLFHPLMKFLFRPTAEILSQADNWLKKSGVQDVLDQRKLDPSNPKRTKLFSIQIRRNENENMGWFREKHEKFFWDCAKRNLFPEAKDYRVMIFSDNSTVRDHAIQAFGKNRVLYYDSGHPLNFKRDRDSVKDALVDAWIMGMADDFIVSKLSTFGHLGHGRANKAPLVMHKDDKGRAWCQRARTNEPEFHWWYRYKNIGCSAWTGADERRGELLRKAQEEAEKKHKEKNK